MNPQCITFSYTNWRGERSRRWVQPIKVWFGVSEYHQTPQWFLHAWDMEKQERRDFALKDIEFYVASQRIKEAEELRDRWKEVALGRGVCPTCALGAPEPFGCSDCLNTGWDQGRPYGFIPDPEKS